MVCVLTVSMTLSFQLHLTLLATREVKIKKREKMQQCTVSLLDTRTQSGHGEN